MENIWKSLDNLDKISWIRNDSEKRLILSRHYNVYISRDQRVIIELFLLSALSPYGYSATPFD